MRLRATDSKNAFVDDPLPRRTSTPRLQCWHVGLCAVVALGCCLRAMAQSAGEDFKSYPLRYKSAADVEKMLAELLPDAGGATQLSVDTRNNRLLVRGSEKTQATARELIASVDKPAAARAAAKSVLNVYSCNPATMSDTAEELRALYSTNTNVRIAEDADTAQLFVMAPPELHATIARQLGSAGRPAEGMGAKPAAKPATARAPRLPRTRESQPTPAPSTPARVERFVPLTSARLEQVEPLVRQLCGPRLQPRPSQLPGQSEYLLTNIAGESVDIRTEPRRNGITILGPESLVDQVAQLIGALDSPRQATGRTVRIVPLRNADSNKVRKAVDAYRYGGDADAAPLRATPDERGSGLLPVRRRGERQLSNTGQHVRSGVSFVNYVFQASGESAAQGQAGGQDQPAVQPPADGADANQQEADRRDRLRELGVDLDIEALPDLDVVILRGNQRDVDEVVRIIQEIERLSAETEPAIEVYTLEHVSGEALAPMIALLNRDLNAGRQGRISVTPLIKPNALLLIGWGEAVKSVKELIAKLDQPVAPESQLRVFRLRHAPATAAALTVSEFLGKRAGLGPKAIVTPDVRSNSLIVHAAPRDMTEVELLIQRLDTGRSESVNQVKVFKLKNTLAADLATVLQAAIDAPRGAGQGAAATGQKSSVLELLTIDAAGEKVIKSGILNDVKITPDPRTNTLLVSAPAESLELVAALIRQLDEQPTAVSQIKVFRIVNGDASSLIQMLRTLLGTQTGGPGSPQLASAEGDGSLAPLRFSVDQRTNSIIATGSMGDLAIIEALLLRLDEKDVKQRKNAVYRLKNAPALDVASAINEFLRSERQVQQATPGTTSPFQQIESEVVVVPEPVGNSLIISATPRYFDDISELVEKLDAQPPQVMIQVLIAEVALSNTNEFGVEMGLQDALLFDRSLLGDLVTTSTTTLTPGGTVADTIIVGATNTPGFGFNNAPLGNSGAGSALANASRVGAQGLSSFAVGRVNSELGFGGLVLSASSESVSVLVRALQESRRLEVLSRPQVMTLDNQPAFIQVGQRVPRIIGTTINLTGQVNNIALENVGLILGVTPRISPEGMVVMEIDAEKSEVGPDIEGIPVSVSTDGTIIRSPRIDTTTAQTTVSAQSGETIVLGGLITKGRSTVDRRVPYLSSIPVLGSLFRYDSVVSRRRELLIILTPHVIRNAQDAERIKQIEASRMNWCAADVHALHGIDGMCTSGDCPICNAQTPVLYPDLSPRGLVPDAMRQGEVVPPLSRDQLPQGQSPQGPLPQGQLPQDGVYPTPDLNLQPPAELPVPRSTLSIQPTGYTPAATGKGPVALPQVRPESPTLPAGPTGTPLESAAPTATPTPPPDSAKRSNWLNPFKSKR